MSSVSGTGRSGRGPSSADIIHGMLNSSANSSGPSAGSSSLVTNGNSALSGGPQLRRNASFNTESYTRLPASPMSFSSNNISGSSVMDGSSIVQQSPCQEQIQNQGSSSMTSQPLAEEQGNHKQPRLDFRQDDALQQQVIQQLLQRQESLQLQGHHSPQLQAIIHQQRLVQRQQEQQQMLQSIPHMQHDQSYNQPLRHQLQQNAMQPAPPVRRSFDSGICARRLMQYMYHQRNRPADNTIMYWRKFVLEYFAPRAKKRWCLSMYGSAGNHALGAFPQTSMDVWQCDICRAKTGKGFEASFEVLPRLCQVKFDHGVLDELLFLDMPHECRLSNGIMVLEYAKAVQESVYEHVRVVHEGQLRIIFTPELKILSWEFCARDHQEFLSRRLVAPQVNQLLQFAQKYQSSVTESGSAGIAHEDLQASCNMFVTAGRQLARGLELQSLNDLGFSKRYVRCLQVAEVVTSMIDLIDFCREHKIGPIEGLKNYPQQAAHKLQNQQIQEMEQLVTANSRPVDLSILNKMMAVHPGINSHMNGNIAGTRALQNNAQSITSLNDYQKFLKNSVSTNQTLLQMDALTSFNDPSQTHMKFQGSSSSNQTNTPLNGLSVSGPLQAQVNARLPQQNYVQSSVGNQHLQQQVFQQMFQEVMTNSRGTMQQLRTPNTSISGATGDFYCRANGAGGLPVRANSGPVRNGHGMGSFTANIPNSTMSRSNSLKSVSNKPTVSGSSQNSQTDLPWNVHMPELDHDMAQEFTENGISGSEAGAMGYGWKL